MTYQYALEIDLTTQQVFSFFADLEQWFRLNPQWHVLAYASDHPLQEGSNFSLKVEYDRDERIVEYRGLIAALEPERRLVVRLEGNGRREMMIEVWDARFMSVLKYREFFEQPPPPREQLELNLWLKSVANYLQIAHRRNPLSRLWKWFLDRYWLKMSPSGRRTAFFVIAAEGLSLVFFLLILLWIIIFKGI